MAYLTEEAEWTEGVYQIEKEDDILGVSHDIGPDNKPHRDLAKRTRYLKQRLGTITEVLHG